MSHALSILSDLVLKVEGAEAAMPYAQEALGICRDIAEESPTLQQRNYLAIGLSRNSTLVFHVEGAEAAMPYAQEALGIAVT